MHSLRLCLVPLLLTGCTINLATDMKPIPCDLQLRDERGEKPDRVFFTSDVYCVTPRPIAEAVAVAACKGGITGTGALTRFNMTARSYSSELGGDVEIQMDDGRRARAAVQPTSKNGGSCQAGFDMLLSAIADNPRMTK